MRIGKLRMAIAAFGALAQFTATARCGSAQEKVEVEEQDGKSAPFMVRSGSFGGGTYLGVYISEVDADDVLSLIHISEPTRLGMLSRMPSSA